MSKHRKHKHKEKYFHFREQHGNETYPYAWTVCGKNIGSHYIQDARLAVCPDCDRLRIRRYPQRSNSIIPYGGMTTKAKQFKKAKHVKIKRHTLVVQVFAPVAGLLDGNE